MKTEVSAQANVSAANVKQPQVAAGGKTEVSAQANVSVANVEQPQVAAGGNDPEIDKAVRRSVGIAALRRLRGMVDAENAQGAVEHRWAARLSWFFALAAALLLAWLAFR